MKGRLRPGGLSEGEPAVRGDGRCVVCRGERPPVVIVNRDPFCCTGCSRQHYGVIDVWARRGRAGRPLTSRDQRR